MPRARAGCRSPTAWACGWSPVRAWWPTRCPGGVVEPIVVTPGQNLQVICTWNTRGDVNPVMPGWGRRNEMCLAGLFVALPE